jgi:CRISPR-associated protein Cmr3
MVATRLVLTPRDGMFFKDGRGWYASASGRGHAVSWPFPSSMLGAVRTAWGRAAEAAAGTVFSPDDWRERTKDISLGPMIALRRRRGEPWSSSCRMWPVPADAWCTEGSGTILRLDPRPRQIPTLGRDEDDARESLWRPDVPVGKPSELHSFWSEEEFIDWLCGRPVPVLHPEERQTRTLHGRIQMHVRIDPETGTAAKGALFASETLETLQYTNDELFEWGIGITVELSDDANAFARLFTLGSDSRIATWEHVDESVFAPPEARFGEVEGLRVVAATPLCFAEGWLPDGFSVSSKEYRGQLPGVDGELILRAAFIPRPTHVSGWDMVAKQPKATRRLVPPGAIYFFQRANRSPFTASETKSLWFGPVGQSTHEGFGRVIAGPWEVS